MHYPNQIQGAERALGIGSGLSGDNTCAAGTQATGAAMCGESPRPDRQRTISATVDVPAHYDFGTALHGLRNGSKVTRAGWNGRGQHVELQWPDKHSRMTQPYAVLRNSDGDLVPWVPSQGDLFANDWAVLPS